MRSISILLMSILSVVQIINSLELKCDFTERSAWKEADQLYGCEVLKLIVKDKTTTVTNFIGNHDAHRDNNDVQEIAIRASEVSFIPQNVGSLFKLISFIVQEALLLEIKAKDFDNMDDLQYLSLAINQLKVIPSDAFAKLKKLKKIKLSFNFLEELKSDIFHENSNLEMILLNHNRIQFIGAYVFKNLNKLHFVNFISTFSLNAKYNGTEAIAKLNKDILPFKRSDEILTTTQHPLQEELNTMNDKYQIMSKECDELTSYLKSKVTEQQKELDESIAKIETLEKQKQLIIQPKCSETELSDYQKLQEKNEELEKTITKLESQLFDDRINFP